jgi:hypothetical protein
MELTLACVIYMKDIMHGLLFLLKDGIKFWRVNSTSNCVFKWCNKSQMHSEGMPIPISKLLWILSEPLPYLAFAYPDPANKNM